VVTRHDQQLAGQRVQHVLAEERVVGADDDELRRQGGQQRLGDGRIRQERGEPGGGVAARRSERGGQHGAMPWGWCDEGYGREGVRTGMVRA
jgi:hypothetical protein